MMDKVIFFGGDGGCLDAYFLACELFDINEKVVLSDAKLNLPSGSVLGGGFSDCTNFEGCHFVFQCGSVENHRQRHVWFEFAHEKSLVPLTCISSHAYVHPTAEIGRGSIVYPGARILANVRLGENVIVLPNVVINHDCKIGSFSIINSNSILNGGVKFGRNLYCGSGANIREKCTIEEYSTLGMGSLVLKDIKETGLYYGSPAKRR